jgi:outer membrane protein
MKMKSILKLTGAMICSIMLNPAAVSAQSPVFSLQQCIDEAITNNTTLKMSRLNVEMQRNTLQQAKASLLPTLTANASHGYNWGQTVDLYTNQFASERVQTNNFYVQTGVTLFNGFRLLNMATQQHLNLMARQLDSDKAVNDIMLNVATAYMQVLYSEEQVNITEGQLGITQQQLARTLQLLEGGMLARGEQLALEAQVAAEEVNVVRARNALDMAYLVLAQVMNLAPGKMFTIATPDPEAPEISQTLLMTPLQIYHTALGIQPQIKASEVMVAGAEAGLKAARGGALPTLYLTGSMGTGFSGARKDYAPVFSGFAPNGMFTSGFDTVFAPQFTVNETLRPFGNQISDNFNQSVALYLSIPIFNGMQNHIGVKNARLALVNARYSLELQEQLLLQEIQQAHADANAAMKSYLAAKKSLDALNEAFLYATERFSVGLINSLEYNDAKNRLMAAEAQMLSARYEYIFKTRLLDFYMGKEITL